MLSQDAIDNLMQPIIDRQESINNYVIGEIANRVKQVGQMSKSDLKQLKALVDSGADIKRINENLSKQLNLQIKDTKALIKDVAEDQYLDAKPFYDYRYKTYKPFADNKRLQSVTNAIAKETNGIYKNIANTRATGFLALDRKHPGKLRFKSIKDTYVDTIDTAIQAVQSGSMSFEVAVRRAIHQLSRSGLRRIYWDSGYTKRLDAAVRQAIHDGIKQLQLQMQREIAEQIGADGWLLSAHRFSAPDHEPIQGHQFTLEEFDNLQSGQAFTDTWGNHFSGIERAIGMWNCRHWARAVILGANFAAYRPETLERYKKENAKGYTLPNGKHMTMYECTQYQRQLEAKIRDAKSAQIAAKAAGDVKGVAKYQAEVAKWTKQYNAFNKACGLSGKKDRIAVTGYRKVS